MNWNEVLSARDHYCPLISKLIIEALEKNVDVDDLAYAIAFPFGQKDWPGKVDGSGHAMEIARAGISYIHFLMQKAMIGEETDN
jgi:hypothetical protein